jgi:hypothetical protein
MRPKSHRHTLSAVCIDLHSMLLPRQSPGKIKGSKKYALPKLVPRRTPSRCYSLRTVERLLDRSKQQASGCPPIIRIKDGAHHSVEASAGSVRAGVHQEATVSATAWQLS